MTSAPDLLLSLTLKVTVVLAVTLFVASVARGRGAAVRHWILVAGVAGALSVPVVSLLVPAWGHPLPSADTLGQAAVWPSVSPDRSGLVEPTATAVTVERPAAVGPARRAPGADVRRGSVSVGTVLIGGWLVGAATWLAVLAVSLGQLRLRGGRARPVSDARLRRLCASTAAAARLHGPIRWRQGGADVLTWGWRRPLVLLPAGATAWSDERVRLVLAHELAHVRRGDWLTQLMGEGLRAAQWFNPCVWVVCARLRDESEHACDDEVLGGGANATSYATHLVELARLARANARARRWLPARAIVRPPTLERRIVAMLSTGTNRRRPSASLRAALALLFLVVALGVSGYGAGAQEASVVGLVVDPAGHPVAGADVSLRDRSTQEVRTFVSDRRGRFAALDLPAGTHGVGVAAPGFQRLFRPLTLEGGDRADETFMLEVGRLEETITVSYTGEERVPRPVTASPNRQRRTPDPDRQLQPPIKIRDLAPSYPGSAAAREPGFEATVKLDALLKADGFVEVQQIFAPLDVRTLVFEHQDLARAAVEAVEQWQYDPTLLHGVPIDVSMDVSITFRAE